MNAINLRQNETRTDFPSVKAYVIEWESNNKFIAQAWKSNAKKNYSFYYSFKFDEKRKDYIQKWIKNLENHKALLAERKVNREQPSIIKTGDCLHASWGYDQTNNNFYQVIKCLPNNFIIIREINSHYEETGFMAGNATPIKDAFLTDEPELKKKVQYGNYISFNSYKSASLTEWNKSHYESSYA